MKWSWIAAAVLLALATAAVLYAVRPKPVSVETAAVTRGPMSQSVDVEAKTRVRQRYVVAAAVAGRLSRVNLLEGDRVKAGTIVATLDPLPQNAAVESALAQIAELQQQRAGVETLRPKPEAIAQAESRAAGAQAAYRVAVQRRDAASAAYAQARRETARAAQLERGGYLPRAGLESAQLAETSRSKELAAAQSTLALAATDVEAAQAAVAELRAKQADPEYLKRVYDARIAAVRSNLRALADQAARTAVRAPVSGAVLRVAQKSEQYVAAGTPLLELGDVHGLEIVADVLSSDAVRMRPGNTIEILRGAGDRRLTGRVRYVEPAGYTKVSALGIEEQRVNVIGDFTAPTGNLGDQYRLDVRITTWQSPNVLRIPQAALFRCADAWCAFAVESGRAKRVHLRIGHQSDRDAEVLSGLTPNQPVILHPTDRIDDNTPVSP